MRCLLAILLCFLSCSFIKPRAVVEEPMAKPAFIHYNYRGEVQAEPVKELIEALRAANRQDIPVLLEIDSQGGEYEAGFLLSKAIEASNIKIVCVVDGKAFSMASFILQSCPVRVMTKRSLLMIHGPRFIPNEDLSPEEKETVMKKVLPFTAARKLSMIEQYSQRMYLSTDEIANKIVDDTEWYLGWEEAFSLGAVDAVVPLPEDALKILLEK